jgi:hypothetical protein
MPAGVIERMINRNFPKKSQKLGELGFMGMMVDPNMAEPVWIR